MSLIKMLHHALFSILLVIASVYSVSTANINATNVARRSLSVKITDPWGDGKLGMKLPDRKQTILVFREVFIRTLLYGATPSAHLFGIATSIVLAFVQGGSRKLSAWEEVEQKVREMIHEKIDDNNINQLSRLWNQIELAMKDNKALSAAKIKNTIAMSPSFFPHNNPGSARYSVRWPMTMMRYYADVLAMMIDLRDKAVHGGISGCEWTRIWNFFRQEIIMAGKNLARSRWSMLKGTDWHGGTRFAWYKEGKYTYYDKAKAKYYREIPVNEVKTKVIGVIENQITNFLFEHLGRKYNALNIEVQEPTPRYVLKRNSSRCVGGDRRTESKGQVRNLATCAALCNGVSKYFSFAKPHDLLNQHCNDNSGIHECECNCEKGHECNEEPNQDFDVFTFNIPVPNKFKCSCTNTCGNKGWCFLVGGLEAKHCAGAVLHGNGDIYFTDDKSICSKAEYIFGPPRSDLRCGITYNADCNGTSSNPCCNSNGYCGGTAQHCECEGCRSFKDFKPLQRASECDGSETHEGDVATVDECAKLCKGKSQMFIFGTTQHGVTGKCSNGKCRCYCEHETDNFQSSYRCKSTISNMGYDLYAFKVLNHFKCECDNSCGSKGWCYLSGGLESENCPGAIKSTAGNYYWTEDKTICAQSQNFRIINTASECDGRETFHDFRTIEECANLCKGKSQMFIFGTTQHGVTDKCSNGKCRCYCEHETTNFQCDKTISSMGYNLYAFQAWTCPRGDLLTPNDFRWPLPTDCYGRCKPGKSVFADLQRKAEGCPKNQASDLTRHRCDLPCSKYDGDSNVPECLIRGGYTNPDRIFDRAQDCFDCDECTMADWQTCMTIEKPREIFTHLYND